MKKGVLTDVVWVNPDGKPTQYFIELIQSLSENGLSMPVSKTAPTNGKVLTFSTTTNKWEPV